MGANCMQQCCLKTRAAKTPKAVVPVSSTKLWNPLSKQKAKIGQKGGEPYIINGDAST